MKHVKRENLRLDFMTYNIYSDNQEEHLKAAKLFNEIMREFDQKIKLYITELNVRLCDADQAFEDNAYLGARAASLSATLLALQDSQTLDGTFQYHIVDLYTDVAEFEPFYKITRYMARHWNDFPHRLGLFDWEAAPRPQYFMYKLLYDMDGERLLLDSGGNDHIHAVASAGENKSINIFICNYHDGHLTDLIGTIKLKNNPLGLTRLTVYRIDDEKRWDDTLNLKPIEDRTTFMAEDFCLTVYLPANSVTMISLKPQTAAQ